MDEYCCDRFAVFAGANGLTKDGGYRLYAVDGEAIEFFEYCPFCGAKLEKEVHEDEK